MSRVRRYASFAGAADLIRSAILAPRHRIIRVSVRKGYFGLPMIAHWATQMSVATGAQIEIREEGFLILGSERSAFRGWVGAPKVLLEQDARLVVRGRNQIGSGSLVWVLKGGRLELGGNDTFTSGMNTIIARTNVEIGRGCRIAWGVTICDHDFHTLYVGGTPKPESLPIKIGDMVWIGMNATILKGVTIGDGSVIGAGAVINRDVPPRSLAIGNPMKIASREVDFRG